MWNNCSSLWLLDVTIIDFESLESLFKIDLLVLSSVKEHLPRDVVLPSNEKMADLGSVFLIMMRITDV